MMAIPYCLWLETHPICLALRLALARAGKSNAARMAMIAITTSNSIRVNAGLGFVFISLQLLILQQSCRRVCDWWRVISPHRLLESGVRYRNNSISRNSRSPFSACIPICPSRFLMLVAVVISVPLSFTLKVSPLAVIS